MRQQSENTEENQEDSVTKRARLGEVEKDRIGDMQPFWGLEREGAPEHEERHKLDRLNLKRVSVDEAMQTIVGLADLESSKRQERAVWRSFKEFVSASRYREEKAENVPQAVVAWLTSLWKKAPSLRTSTVLQKARTLQACLPEKRFLASTLVKKFIKGLARLQALRPPPLEVASEGQVSNMYSSSQDCLMKVILLFLDKAAARLSDIRIWLGGQGRLQKKGKTLSLILERRKTDQMGSAPMEHYLGPIAIPKSLEDELKKASKFLWSSDPARASRSLTPKKVLQNLQSLKRKVGLKSIIALRRRRAKLAASRTWQNCLDTGRNRNRREDTREC